MPSIRASAKPDLKGWEPSPASPAGNVQTSNPPNPPYPLSRSPFMHASMPLMASTGDAFARQFYSSSNLPQERTLPAKKGGGA